MDDLESRKIAKNYPTTGCLIACAIIGAVLFCVIAPIAWYILMMFMEAMSHA